MDSESQMNTKEPITGPYSEPEPPISVAKMTLPENTKLIGNLDAEDVDALVPLLAAATETPNECHYALWQGWGWVHPG